MRISLTKKQKKSVYRILLSSFLILIIFVTGRQFPQLAVFFHLFLLIPYLIVGYDVLRKALLGIQNRQIFDENFLMSIATIGAILLGETIEGIAVMLFYQIGELFQSIAVGQSRDYIKSLTKMNAEYANLFLTDGATEEVDPSDVEIGSMILVKPGEKIPLDGVVIEGSSSLNQSALTGESVPRDVTVSDSVLSGSINLNGMLKIQTTKSFDDSTASKILELIESAAENKSKSEALITRFAAIYTPLVVCGAAVLAILPPLVLFALGYPAQLWDWIFRALTFLVISCPCALVLSVPLTFFSGIGCASRQGILMKGSNYLERLNQVSTIVMDKTGTLTKAEFKVSDVQVYGNYQRDELLNLAANVEVYSNHPLAKCIVSENPIKQKLEISSVQEISGKGLVAEYQGSKVLIGNEKLLEEYQVSLDSKIAIKDTVLHVAYQGIYLGYIEMKDVVKSNAKQCIDDLHHLGIKQVIMLTGDREEVAQEVCNAISLDGYYSNLLPQDKVTIFSKLKSQLAEKESIVFVGDGLNDAPSLAIADVGIAMGGLGTDAAIEASDIVLTDDNLEKLPIAIEISRKTMRIVKENIFFAVGVKILFLLLSALGYANMWMAIFSDVGVLILAVLNASKCLKYTPLK